MTSQITSSNKHKETISKINERLLSVIDVLKANFTGWRAAIQCQQDLLNYRNELLLALTKNGILDQEQIEKGLDRARMEAAEGEKYLPSPMVFAKWCKGAQNGSDSLSEDAAFNLVIMKRWDKLHPAFKCILADKVYNLRMANENEARRRFKGYFKDIQERIKSGETFEYPTLPRPYSGPEIGYQGGESGPKRSNVVKMLDKFR